MMSWERERACHWLGFGVAMGAPELLRGRTGARKIALLALSHFAERVSAADDVWFLWVPS